MAEKKFVFYGVDNGQCVKIVLDDETNLLFDLKQRPDDAEDSDKCWDVKESLLKELPEKENGRTYLSVFCLSHADLDHCQGFGDVFLLPGQNNDDDDDTLIQIDELWVTAQIFNEEYSSQAEKVQTEARRRLKLWADPDKRQEAEKPGNMLVVFGRYEDEKGIDKLPEDRHIGAGDTLDLICGKERNDFSAFVHWPFKEAVDDEEVPRNEVSLVMQITVSDDTNSAQMLIGGDAGCEVWETIYNKTEDKNNLESLDWDIFLIPHHGTYKFFTKKEHEEGRDEAKNNPEQTSMDILGRGKDHGWLVCSSRPVLENNYDDEMPPHIEAISHYRNRAEELGDKKHFVCLMEYPKKSAPKPLEIRLTSKGLQKQDRSASGIVTGAAAVSQTHRWGK